MRIVFLDVDGVLNRELQQMSHPDNAPDFDIADLLEPSALLYLNELVTETGAKIVLSSAWRGHAPGTDNLVGRLKAFGLEIFCMTKHDPSGCRGIEVEQWLYDNKKKLGVESYVIIDDEFDFLLQQTDFLVRTDGYHGFSRRCKYRAKYILENFDEVIKRRVERETLYVKKFVERAHRNAK